MSSSQIIRRLVSMALAAVVLSGCSHTKADPRLEPPLVRTASLTASPLGETRFSGIVSARVESHLGFRVPGKVVARLVDAGQIVRKGQILMRLDQTDLALADAASRRQVEAAKAQAIQTAADEKRLRGLVRAGAVSASAYDQAKAASDAAAARLRAAVAQQSISADEARYSALVADSDGVVMQTLAEPGQVVAVGQEVVRLAHAGPREALVYLPETVRPAVGSIAEATLYGANARSVQAKLRLLSDAADPVTRTFEARYVLEGSAAGAPLGSTVVIRIPNAAASAPSIPLAAIYDFGKGPGVWIVSGNPAKVKWHAIQIGSLGEETATVTAGLTDGEQFIALGAHQLHDGEVVRLDKKPEVAP